jgi:glycosyltransferase involved in cell wall biosynthesis
MLAIGAIFRDEYDYLVEWFAWHLIAGFKRFLIADNGSTDGTLALLEALSDLGVINLIYQPVLEKQAQLVAYQRIAQLAINEAIESVLYIDADEFIVHESMLDGEEYRHLENLLTNTQVGMVGINWRTFGSSGQKIQTSEPVVKRFTDYLGISEQKFVVNQHVKSVTKISHAKEIKVHTSILISPFKQVDVNGKEITEWIFPSREGIIFLENSGITKNVINGPVRINHYVVKSEQEYTEKKRRRGSATRGPTFDRGVEFFKNHDVKGSKFSFSSLKLDRLKQEMDYLQSILNTTVFGRKLRGALDLSNSTNVSGWLVNDNRQSDGIKINIFVNGVWKGRVCCGFYRQDLKEKKLSITGFSGFRYTHPKPLSSGDVVEVKVHANRFVFPEHSRTTIA